MLGKVAQIIYSKRFILFFVIANILFLLSNLSLIILFTRNPQNTVFPLYHNNNPTDQNVYLSVITLGQNGYMLNRDAFTSENTKPGIFYLFYIVAGKINSAFHLWPPILYHLTRIVTVEFFFIALYFLCFMVLGKNLGFWASLFSITATINPISWFDKATDYSKFYPWWMDLEPFQRLNGLPHHVFGEAMLLTSIIFIICFIRTQKFRYSILSAVSILVQGIVLPPSLFPLLLGFPLTCLYLFFSKIPKSIRLPSKMTFVAVALIIISISIPILLSKWQTNQGYPWSAWITWEIAKWNWMEQNFNRDLFFSFSLVAIFSILGLREIIFKRSWEKVFIFFWAITPFMLLPFVDIFQIGKIRLVSTAPFVPFGIICAISIFKTINNKMIKIAVLVLFISINTFISVNFLVKDIRNSRIMPLYTNLFTTKEVFKTISFIGKKVPKDSVIISNEYAGNLIPAYTPTISYFGHINQTMDFEKKQDNTRLFFSEKMNNLEAKKFVSGNRISYIYFGPEEKVLGDGNLKYDFLENIFQTENIILYKVKSGLL